MVSNKRLLGMIQEDNGISKGMWQVIGLGCEMCAGNVHERFGRKT